MNKAVIILAHPNMEESRVNKRWIEEVSGYTDKITVHDLYKEYSEWSINIKKEQEYFDYIQNNPEEFKKNDKLKVLTAPVLHGQIRFYYFDEKKVKQNKQMHLSSEKPNILVFDESGGSKKRKDNKIDAFLKDSIRIFGNVYMKKD